jgi:hypothetical protein
MVSWQIGRKPASKASRTCSYKTHKGRGQKVDACVMPQRVYWLETGKQMIAVG